MSKRRQGVPIKYLFRHKNRLMLPSTILTIRSSSQLSRPQAFITKLPGLKKTKQIIKY